VSLSLVFTAQEFDSHNWWGRNSSQCARQWLHAGVTHETTREAESM